MFSLKIFRSYLNFNTHIDQKIEMCNKMIGLIRRVKVNLSRNASQTMQKQSIRTHLEYDDILYDKRNNKNF